MHPIQKKLLELSQNMDLSALPLRQVTRMVGEIHPQKVKHHMQQLGLLAAAPESKTGATQSKLIPIPLMGLANCGEATIYAESYENKYIQISQRIIPQKSEKLFAVQAVGNSMNQANINGDNIENGDYVLVNPDEKDFKNGDYVLSIINGMANIKKFTKNVAGHQIVLLSESSDSHPPIYLHEDDMSYFMTSGKVIAVLKKPRETNSEDVVFTDI
jgi:SOS-response transcriptional repressor LexA